MAKSEAIEVEGVVLEKVTKRYVQGRNRGGHVILAHISGS